MDNNKIEKIDGQSEYQFDSAEVGNTQDTVEIPSLEAETPKAVDQVQDFKTKLKNLGKNRQILKPLLLIAAVILVYMIFNLMGAYHVILMMMLKC